MRVIDLLNKIANKEKLPEQIKIYDEKLRLNENKDNYLYEESDEYYGNEFIHWFNLNTGVEIIEEDKKIEKFDPCLGGIMGFEGVEHIFETYKDKINEIIDYLGENK